MRCVRCLKGDTKVLESRLNQDGFSVRRRRTCPECNFRFTTYEKQEELAIQVEKKDGSFEPFSLNKIVKAMKIACTKRPVSPILIQDEAQKIVSQLIAMGEPLVKSRLIGDLTIQALQGIDPVAYVRFASIYKDFKDPEAFARELQRFQPVAGPPKSGGVRENVHGAD